MSPNALIPSPSRSAKLPAKRGSLRGARKGASPFASALKGGSTRPPSPRTPNVGRGPAPKKESRPDEGRSQSSPKRSPGEGPEEAFSPPPSVLSAPLGSATPPPAAGSGVDLARARAMADRLLESVSISEIGSKGRALRLRLRPSDGASALDVRLVERDGELHVEVDAQPDDRRAALAFAEKLAEELRGRGLDAAEIEVVA